MSSSVRGGAGRPLGGEVPQDYTFEDADGKKVLLSELFAPGKDTLIVYSFMFGPQMANGCPSCTSMLDGLDGQAPHVSQRVNLKGGQMPVLNVFVRRDGRIHHFYSTELLFVPPEPGQDGRHVDMIWPLWNLFDVTPEGRGEKWHPRLSY